MSVRLVLETTDLARATAMLGRLGQDPTGLMTDIGAVLESSMRARVEETKTAPDGTAWVPNRAGTSTLLATGRHLRDSLAFIASSDQVEVGASWEFAHVHQFGATITPKQAEHLAFMAGGALRTPKSVTIPARPFAGMSADDARDVERIATDWLDISGAAL